MWVKDLINRLKKGGEFTFHLLTKALFTRTMLFFFFNFILWYLVCLGLSFIIYFISLMDLSLSYDLSHKFGGLTYVDWVFLLFFIDFFYFIIQLVEWDLNIIIYFDLFSMGLSQSYNLSHGCDGFTRVIFLYFIFFKFYPLTMSWLMIELYNIFQFAFYKVILVSWSKRVVWRVNLCWLRLFYVFFVIDFFFNFII